MAKYLLLVAVLLTPNMANAIGDTEKGVLYGLGAGWLWGKINEPKEWEPQSTYPQGFPEFHCHGDSIECAYKRGVYEREKELWNKRKEAAYECGRYGRNCEGGQP